MNARKQSLPQAFWNNPPLLLTATCLLWAGNAIASKWAVGQISPMSLVFGRWIIVCLTLALLLWRRLPVWREALRARRWTILALGAGGFTAFTTLFYIAAYFTSAVNLTLIQSVIPAFVLLGGAIFFKTPIRGLQMFGLSMAGAGVALVAAQGDLSHLLALKFNIGDVMLLLGCLCYAGFALGLRFKPNAPPLVFFAAMALSACLTSLPGLLIEAAMGRFYWPTLSGWAILAFVAFGPSLASQLMFMRGVELIGPGRAGQYTNLTPVFGAFLAVAILGEPFAPYHAIALALTLSGVWLGEKGALK